MNFSHCDVAIIGAGAAGTTAAIGLARAGFRVVLIEAAAYAGAENWSGCVYFAENLAHLEILGSDGVERLAWERRLVERGFFATDGHGLLGMKYRDAEAFRHCYTVLRPIYDHHLSVIAVQHGVQLLTNTTAESLIREAGRVVGACTNRGPLYAKLTFLAEGDASHLVTREGYERSRDPRNAPKFLQGIKQVLELPPRAIEERFGVGAEDGVAYEMLVRNGKLRGKKVHLNMGGFIYTNRQSLSVGLVLPADNLHEHFEGDPNLLMEWFLRMPSLQTWLEGAKQGPFGAKVIRGGGAKDVPTLIDDGLAIGGAASAIGIDFPYPNFTGPATAMGLLIAQAARKVREEGGSFSRDDLDRHYLKPLQKTHYWQDVEFLRNWPGYVKKTSVFFDRNIDVALGSAYLWTRPGKGMKGRVDDWLHLIRDLTGGEHNNELQADMRHITDALRIRDVAPPPSPWRLLLDGALNTARDVLGQPRKLPPHGEVSLHYTLAGGAEPGGLPPPALLKWFDRFAPALAAAARTVYSNDTIPLHKKLPAATRLLTQHVNFGDLARAMSMAMTVGSRWFKGPRNGKPAGEAAGYFRKAEATSDLTPVTANAAAAWDARLAKLSYDTVKTSHIHVAWPHSLPDKNSVAKAGLWHVCPAHVYEARVSPSGQLQVVVNFENCIKCETCWRTSDIVDWSRDGAHRFVYAVHSPVVTKLLADMELSRGQAARGWGQETGVRGQGSGVSEEVAGLLERLDRKLAEYDDALKREPRTIDRDRAEYLETLVRYAYQMALQLASAFSDNNRLAATRSDAQRNAGEHVAELLALTERRLDHVAARRYSWAASDGRLLRFHQLPALRQSLADTSPASASHREPITNSSDNPASATLNALLDRLESEIPQNLWRDLEQQKPLSADQNRLLHEIIGLLPVMRPKRDQLGLLLKRRQFLAFLAGRDPSLAYRVASHIWARDVATLAGGPCADAAHRWGERPQWACLAVLNERGEALMTPARDVQWLLILQGTRLRVCTPTAEDCQLEPVGTLGLRGAGLARFRCDESMRSEAEQAVDRGSLARAWELISAFDLAAIVEGIANYLSRRATDHAGGRVQFPGLFHDEESRDTIGKFGAVKKMVAEIAAGQLAIQVSLPAYYVEEPPTVNQNAIKAVLAETLASAPGSIAYNAGQVFGGTGYSEDDTLSKLYRDAAAFRFLGVSSSEAYARHGEMLLRNWAATGEKLSRTQNAQALADTIAQRQVLARELAQIREHAKRLTDCINAWNSVAPPSPEARSAFVEAVGRQDAFLFVSESLLNHVNNRLEFSIGEETDLPLLRTWLNKVDTEFDAFLTLVGTLIHEPMASVACASGATITQYAEFLKADLPYSSGDFLNKPTDPMQARYVPEMVETDAYLSRRNRELIDLVQKQFGQPRSGKVYERCLEERHRPEAADLDFLREQGFFRYPIAKELGGEARSKAEYYLLTVNTHRLADAAISLTIQVNSSLGTTPVLLARDKDLPKAIKSATDPDLRSELERRREASDLFCRWVASGQISAFALTEPSAGSDTARVGTRAKLRMVAVEPEQDGVYRFTPFGGKAPRRLLDAQRLVFSAKPQAAPGETQATYRFSDSAEPATIQFDEYDYETDASKKRCFIAAGRKVYFDDVAQIREHDSKLWYEYWELTGAKMWITNGRVMGIMALYAKTDQGVTGFMVDRHAEGLIVGKDEAKMGQNGSPTNELSLQSVRVPRENVIGLEGRGQVNALETLNVGRAGLAMSAMCQMVRLCDWSREFARKRYGIIPPWIGWRLQWMEEERFIAEAMSYEIIGRFEHKQTKSVRMESAIAKMLVSELFHHSIEVAEEIHGLDGQTQEHLVEKRKRDARVLNIYEGTNEIQRFLILKDLTELASAWASAKRERQGSPPFHDDSPIGRIDALKQRLRQLTADAFEFFGQQLWQNPNLQASCFVLSEAVAWIAAAESSLGRFTWLQRKGGAGRELMVTGERALTRCLGEVRSRLDRFSDDLVRLRQGHYPPEIRAASLLFRQEKPADAAEPKVVIKRALSVLVILDAPVPGAPQPRTLNGRITEPYRVLTEGDRAALETALRLRDAGPVRIEVATVATVSAAAIMREMLSLQVERVRLIKADGALSPDCAASALAQALQGDAVFDVVLGGAGASDGQEGLVARLAAEALGVPLAGVAAKLGVDTDNKTLQLVGNNDQSRVRSLPAAVLIEPGVKLRVFTIDGWLGGLEKQVEIVPWPASVAVFTVEFDESATAGAAGGEEPVARPLLPREASRLVLESVGIEVGQTQRDGKTAGATLPTIADCVSPFFAQYNAGRFALAVVACDIDGKLKPTARKTLDALQFLGQCFEGVERAVLVIVPQDDEAQKRAQGELAALTPFDICLLPIKGAESSDEVRCRMLAECWSNLENAPAAVVGEPWTESAFSSLAAASGVVDPIVLRVRSLDRRGGLLVAESGAVNGKLRVQQTLAPIKGKTVWLALTEAAEIGAASPPERRALRRVERWLPPLDRIYGRGDIQQLLQELRHDTGLVRLSDAEFIIDVGFGVGNRDGYEAIIEPLEAELRRLNVRGLTIGGSRKVTEELHLLPADRQIGQSGVSVNPRILLAIGVSGAPQHVNYIGPGASVIAFNRDAEAPLMTLNQRQSRPRVYPVLGDLFETVPALIASLREDGGVTANNADTGQRRATDIPSTG